MCASVNSCELPGMRLSDVSGARGAAAPAAPPAGGAGLAVAGVLSGGRPYAHAGEEAVAGVWAVAVNRTVRTQANESRAAVMSFCMNASFYHTVDTRR